MNATVNEALVELRARAQLCAGTLRERKAAALAQLREQEKQQHGGPAGHTPSGPRRKNEGVEDEDQGVVAAEAMPSGGACLRITLLAAGFVVGPSGSSVREISRQTGADVRSWSESWQDPAAPAPAPAARPRKVRTFVVEGRRRSVVQALHIISAAVDRYNELCGGRYCGVVVDRTQTIQGVSFYYSPPPKAAVPFAAMLRGHDRSSSPPSRKSLHLGSPATNKENAARPTSASTSVAAGHQAQAHLAALLAQQQQQSPRRLAQPLSPLRAGPAAALHALPAPPLTLPHAEQHQHQSVLLQGALGLGASPLLVPIGTGAGASGFSPVTAPGATFGSRLPALASLRRAEPEDEPMLAAEQPEEVDVTPAYKTSYSLFGASAHGGAPFQQDVFGGGSSLFVSAFEASDGPTPMGSGLLRSNSLPHTAASAAPSFLEAPTPALRGGSLFHHQHAPEALPTATAPMSFLAAGTPALAPAPLLRADSGQEDQLLALTGHPTFASFAQQASFFTQQLFSEPGPAVVPPPAPQQQAPMAVDGSGLPLAASHGLWPAPMWQEPQHSMFGLP